MPDSSTTTIPPGRGPWRILVLDASGDDPKWLICTVTLPSDVRPAVVNGGRYQDWAAVVMWVREQVGQPVSLAPVSAVAWRIDEGTPR
jgi:hypothetical protein